MTSEANVRRPYTWPFLSTLLALLFVALTLFPVADVGARPRGKAALTGVGLSSPGFYVGSGSTTLEYTLTRTARVTVTAHDGEGAIVRVFQEREKQDTGPYSLGWDGTDGVGTYLPAGSYALVVTTSTSSGTEQSIQPVELVEPVLSGVGLDPAAFYGGTGSTTFSYTLGGAATVSVWVRDAGDTLVRTLQTAFLSSGDFTAVWDGLDDIGDPVPAGTYSLVVAATTAAGVEQESRDVELVWPVLEDVGLSATAIYTGSGSTVLSYTLAGAATVEVVVRDASDAVVRTVQDPTAQTPDDYAVTWFGRDDDDSSLPAGDYTITITAATAAGTEESTQPVELVAPALGDVSASAATFYGGAGSSGTITVTYTLVAPAAASVRVSDASGTTVCTLQDPVAQEEGSYQAVWDGTRDDGSSLPAGDYLLVVTATTEAGPQERSDSVQYSPTPVANAASLSLDADGGYVLHAVVESWLETLDGQAAGDYYFDGRTQPWEFAGRSGVTLTLYVGADPDAQDDTTNGGSVQGASVAPYGGVDLAFPSSLAWYDAGGAPLPLYYSFRLTAGSSSRWYPADGRYALRAPVGADGHLQFAFASDIQTPLGVNPTPSVLPNSASSPYTAIPRLSRSLGWSAVLSGLVQETDANLLVFGGDAIDKGSDNGAPDDGGTQLRTLFGNAQTLGPGDEWALSRVATQMPVAVAAGNHDGIGDASYVAPRWRAWVHSPTSLPYYSFDQGDVHFVVLSDYAASSDPAANYVGWIGFQDAGVGGTRTVNVGGVESTFTNSAQADWLIGAIDTDKPWTVVVSHYPLFDAYRTSTTAYNDANTTGALTSTNQYFFGERDRLLAFFADHGVDLVLQGHNHHYRRHLEKIRSADGGLQTTMTFLTDGLAGPAPGPKDTGQAPYIDWVDLDLDGVPDLGEPLATADNSPFWDANAFGKQNSPVNSSGYTGTADLYHAIGEYNDGITFSYAVLQTGSDGEGAPTMTLTTKSISWNAATHAWGQWTAYESADVPQVESGMVSVRLAGP
jgi:flagellar hook assembly protein FlgD